MAITPPQRKLSDDYFFLGENSQGGTYYVRRKYTINRSDNSYEKKQKKIKPYCAVGKITAPN